MEITQITREINMPTNATQALVKEVKERQQGQKAKSFELTVTQDNGQVKVSADEIRRMLMTARGSKDYMANFNKYQFKVITHESGAQTLTLKEQGFFSKLKGLVRIGRDKREQQRADAAQLIGAAFSRANLKTGTTQTVTAPGQRMTHADAIEFQRDLMTLSDLAPNAKELRTPAEEKAKKAEEKAQKAQQNSQEDQKPANVGRRHVSDSSGSLSFSQLASGALQQAASGTASRSGDSFVRHDSRDEPARAQPSAHPSSDSSRVSNAWLRGAMADQDSDQLYPPAFEQQPASWQNAPLINPSPFAWPNPGRPDSMDSESSRDDLIGLLTKRH